MRNSGTTGASMRPITSKVGRHWPRNVCHLWMKFVSFFKIAKKKKKCGGRGGERGREHWFRVICCKYTERNGYKKPGGGTTNN